MDSQEEELRKFHKFDLHVASAIGWLSGITIAGFVVGRILTGESRWAWACIPVGLLWLVSGRYEMQLRKQLNDPLIDR